jgi:hypothetical protein
MAGIECRVSCAYALLNLIEQGHLLSGWSARLELSLVCSCPSGCRSPKSALMVPAKSVETRKRPVGGDVDDVFLGSSPRLGWMPVFRDSGA